LSFSQIAGRCPLVHLLITTSSSRQGDRRPRTGRHHLNQPELKQLGQNVEHGKAEIRAQYKVHDEWLFEHGGNPTFGTTSAS
jgi:hypothetical protein